jgi:hypothetical protein
VLTKHCDSGTKEIVSWTNPKANVGDYKLMPQTNLNTRITAHPAIPTPTEACHSGYFDTIEFLVEDKEVTQRKIRLDLFLSLISDEGLSV